MNVLQCRSDREIMSSWKLPGLDKVSQIIYIYGRAYTTSNRNDHLIIFHVTFMNIMFNNGSIEYWFIDILTSFIFRMLMQSCLYPNITLFGHISPFSHQRSCYTSFSYLPFVDHLFSHFSSRQVPHLNNH